MTKKKTMNNLWKTPYWTIIIFYFLCIAFILSRNSYLNNYIFLKKSIIWGHIQVIIFWLICWIIIFWSICFGDLFNDHSRVLLIQEWEGQGERWQAILVFFLTLSISFNLCTIIIKKMERDFQSIELLHQLLSPVCVIRIWLFCWS